jgi:dephospho-CoA kinase
VAPKEVRIQRVMSRDNISREKVLEWMDRQMDQREIIKKSHFVIVNDGQTDIDNQINKIIKLCNKSS